KEIARALGVDLRELEVRLALSNGRLGHFEGGFLLFDLFLDVKVFDLRDLLTAVDPIAKLDRDVLESSRRAWHHRHRRFADQIADHDKLLLHRGFPGRRDLHGHWPGRAPTAEPAEPAEPAPAALLRPATCPIAP